MASSTPMMERMTMGMPGMMNSPSAGMGMPTPSMPTMPSNMMMVPRCTFKIEKCKGGMKMTCTCDDPAACTMVQNLCSTMSGCMCSCCMMMNGMVVCCCNLTMGMCRCEMTPKGVCLTCSSGDSSCAEMLQACCDCLATMLNAGCTGCLMMNHTPICCGCC